MLQNDVARHGQHADQSGDPEHEADLTERTADRAADDDTRHALAVEIANPGVNRDGQLG